jgi:hypothetical protein
MRDRPSRGESGPAHRKPIASDDKLKIASFSSYTELLDPRISAPVDWPVSSPIDEVNDFGEN